MTAPREHVQFGPYLIVRLSGTGVMGRVEVALRVDAKDPDVCVIKRLHGALHDEEKEARFRREAQIAERLEHPNIARTLRIEKIDGELCIVQEFIEGVSLGKVMRQLGVRPLPIVVAVHLVHEVARALGHAHGFGRLGIVHRDVTPENVMLSFDGEVKLIDFGTARSSVDGRVTDTGVVIGRRSYLPPEAWEGEKVDHRADVFALGVVLWEVLTGRRAEEAPEQSLPDPSTLNPDVPLLLGQVVARAMAPAPEDRYQSADEVAAALAAFVDPGADARRALVDLLGLCFNVALQQELLAEEIAEAKAFVRDLSVAPATTSLSELTAPPPAAPTAPFAQQPTPPVPTVPILAQATAKRRSSPGPWLAAGVAAIVATSGIGLLRTHGRAARSRASAASLLVPALPVAPVVSAPPSTALDFPVPPAGVRELLAAGGPAMDGPPPVTRRAPDSPDSPDSINRPSRNAPADRLLRQANDLWERGNTPGAYLQARQAVAAGAGAPAHVLLGALLINMKNYAAAEPELATAARLDPRNAEARRMLALLRLTAAEQHGK